VTTADAAAQVRACVAAGHAVPVQANITGGWIHYEFLGGTYDGVKIRLYPPFTARLMLNDTEVYVRSPPKNKRSKRLTYRLEE
jgi:hypothetical protein